MRVDHKTVEFRDMWLPPVATMTQLPKRGEEGQFCFVQDADEVYIYWEGRWRRRTSI